MREFLIRLTTLTGLTVRDLLRQNVLYLILIPATLTLLTLPLFAALTFEEQIKFMRDFCFGIMSLFGIFLAIIATAQSMANDIEQRTIYTILAKPLHRWEYLFAKGMGVGIIIFLALSILSLLSAALFAFQERSLIASAIGNATHPLSALEIEGLKLQLWSPSLLLAIGLLYLKLLLMIGVTLLCSTVASSSIFTIFTSFMIYVIGHLQSGAREWISSGEGGTIAIKWAVRGLTVIMPDMSFYEGIDRVLLGGTLPWIATLSPLVYTGLNLLWLLGLSTWILESRDFK